MSVNGNYQIEANWYGCKAGHAYFAVQCDRHPHKKKTIVLFQDPESKAHNVLFCVPLPTGCWKIDTDKFEVLYGPAPCDDVAQYVVDLAIADFYADEA